jgi:hypothetical protein
MRVGVGRQSREGGYRSMKRSLRIAIGLGVPLILALAIVVPYAFPLHDPNAVSLDASLNPTTVYQGQTITVTVTLQNKLVVSNGLPLVRNWRVQNLSMGPCSTSPFGIALYQGRYTAENSSMAKSMVIYAPGTYFCPEFGTTSSFRLGPLQSVKDSVDLKGYWTEGWTTQTGGGVSEGILHPFVPGTYTLAAGDLWGHLVLRYFKIIGSTT